MENAAKIKIALAGNPNCGKTTIFNNITGAKQHVGNYPGVTVEKKEGHRTFNGKDLLFVDLPGTYSLTARSLDEVVARNVIINEKPDIIVNVLDASNLERNLYLAAQLVELGRPMVIALNMMDIAERMGIQIDLKKLGKQLGAVVVPLVGSKNIGTKELLDAISSTQTQNLVNAKVDYGADVESAIANLTDAIEKWASSNTQSAGWPSSSWKRLRRHRQSPRYGRDPVHPGPGFDSARFPGQQDRFGLLFRSMPISIRN